MDINLIVNISSRAWSLRILALMHQGTPGRQAPLLAKTNAGRTAFGQSLRHLIDLGLVERNPGHGHPLRPEYRLTAQGIEAAALADQIEHAAPQDIGNTLLRRTWTVPVLAVSHQPVFFSDIKAALPAITDRALSQSLKQLRACEWVTRDVSTEVSPPRAVYQTINAGAFIGAALTAVRQ
ncbi:MAG: winged helix-turn-helix transcriptional regulator [Sulfitobacter sp.]